MSGDTLDRLIEAAEARDQQEAIWAEVKPRLIDAHNRAFWAELRRLTPWLPPFDEAYPDGKV